MKKQSCLLLSATAALTAPIASAAAPKPPLILAPSTKWQIDYANDTCTLARRFGEGDDAVTMTLDKVDFGDSFSLSVFGPKLRMPTYEADGLDVAFGNGEFQHRNYVMGVQANGNPVLLINGMQIRGSSKAEQARIARLPKAQREARVGTMPVSPLEEAAVTQVRFGKPFKPGFVLQTNSMGGAFRALQRCTEDLVKLWGYDPALAYRITWPVPASNPGQWVLESDYPRNELRDYSRALIRFRLDVNKAGSVSKCNILKSAGSETFKAAVCKALSKRASFTPAKNDKGDAIDWYFTSSVFFNIS